jgi:hypothetical protein
MLFGVSGSVHLMRNSLLCKCVNRFNQLFTYLFTVFLFAWKAVVKAFCPVLDVLHCSLNDDAFLIR